MEFNTALLHQQFDSDTQNGATIPPIYQVSAFAQSSAEQLEKVFNNKAAGFAYTRISNPTVNEELLLWKRASEQWLVLLEWQLSQWHC